MAERDFSSDLEFKPYGVWYEEIWSKDALSSDYRAGSDGESVNDVSARVRRLFKHLEETHKGADILLVGAGRLRGSRIVDGAEGEPMFPPVPSPLQVAHGDTHSILQATMEGADTKQHRRFAFSTGELRLLGSGPAE